MTTSLRTRFAFALVSTCLFTGAPVFAAEKALEEATIADLQAAFQKGTLTSEKLTQLYLARIEAYDHKGPKLNTVITPNAKALAEAKALDAERKAGKVRGPLHGIPIVLKDNFDTFDLPTTAGSQLLAGSIPPDDAYVVKKLRDAGAIILAKVNLSEFAGGGGSIMGSSDPAVIKAGTVPNGFSSMGLQTLNPHDLSRGPGGSSGGTGSAIAASFAQFGLGTDTGGSIRNPCSSNGIAGLKPTHGLLSRDGIVPISTTFDTPGPMARSVYDVAVSLTAMTGVDPADAATQKSSGRLGTDYTKALKVGSLKGARIGIARDFMGKDAGTDAVMTAAIEKLKSLGAEIVDPITIPDYVQQAKRPLMAAIAQTEFKVQIVDYLATLKPGFPRNLDDLAAGANDPKTGYRSPEKAYAFKYSQKAALDPKDPTYVIAKTEGIALVKGAIDALFSKHRLDAIVYPTNPRTALPYAPGGPSSSSDSATNFANLTGYPDLIVPAGMSSDGLPVTLSFFGQAFSEAKLLGYGYDFEQATHGRANPKTTPSLPGEKITF